MSDWYTQEISANPISQSNHDEAHWSNLRKNLPSVVQDKSFSALKPEEQMVELDMALRALENWVGMKFKRIGE